MLQAFGWKKIVNALQEHYKEYEDRNLPDLDICVAWAEEILEKTNMLEETAMKFQKQLEQLFKHCEEDNYKQLHERISAAVNYFIKETDEKLLASMNGHIETMEIKNKTKKYVKELRELKHQVERKKLQLQNLVNISRIMHESGNSEDILKAAETLQKPLVIDTIEQNVVKKKNEKGETQRISLQLFKKGNSIAEIAKQRNLAFSTIEGHLGGFVATGEIDILSIVDEIKLEKILKLIEKNPALTSSELKKQLGDNFSYGQIKAVLSYKIYSSENL
jgi:uncharacterized protein YpbB